MIKLVEGSFLRIKDIVRNPKADPSIRPLIPVSASKWWSGVRAGIFPAPLKLGARTTVWKAADVLALAERLESASDTSPK